MKYPIAFCDYDDTIFDSRTQRVSPATLEAIALYRQAGGRFVITTGRIFSSIIKQLARIGLEKDGYIICLQGSVGYDLTTKEQLFCNDLTTQQWHAVASFAQQKGWTYQFYHDKDFYTSFANPYSRYYAAYTGVDPIIVGQPIAQWPQAADWTAHKLILMTPAEQAQDRIALLKDTFPTLDISQSSACYIEVVSPLGGKGNGIRAMCRLLGYTPAQAVSFGDATNDITLLQAAGLGVAVGNAYPALKAVADYVCASCADGGVADVLNAIRLGTPLA